MGHLIWIVAKKQKQKQKQKKNLNFGGSPSK
jgi:hypothetical protein